MNIYSEPRSVEPTIACEALEVGAWYLLVWTDEDGEQRLHHAPIAEYIGDDEFEDEDGRTFRGCNYDRFVRQS